MFPGKWLGLFLGMGCTDVRHLVVVLVQKRNAKIRIFLYKWIYMVSVGINRRYVMP